MVCIVVFIKEKSKDIINGFSAFLMQVVVSRRVGLFALTTEFPNSRFCDGRGTGAITGSRFDLMRWHIWSSFVSDV